MEIDPFPFFYRQKINLSNEKWKISYLDQYLAKKRKTIWENFIPTLQDGRENII